MNKKLNDLNNLYRPALNNVFRVCEILELKKLASMVRFFNNHHVKVDNEFVTEIFPIPVVTFKFKRLMCDIGFDVLANENYIGFIELTLTKKQLLKFDFETIKKFNFEVYGFDNSLQDYYVQTLQTEKVKLSEEKKFHIGINISNFKEIENFLL